MLQQPLVGDAREHLDELRQGAQAAGLELAGPVVGPLGRDEAGLFHRPAPAALEHCDALGTGAFAAGGINVHQQLADVAAGSGGRQLKKSEEHPETPRPAPGGKDALQGRPARSLPPGVG
jgi:hypothetical protein